MVADAGVAGLVASLELLDIPALDRPGVRDAFAGLARVRAWCDVVSARLTRRLNEIAADVPSMFPDADIAAASKSSRSDANKTTKRAETLGAMPELEDALGAGDVSAEHVDAVGRALKRLKGEQRDQLARDGERIAAIASRLTPEELESKLKVEVARLDAKEGTERLARQKRAIRLRSWTDKDTGMVVVRAEYDPESGLVLLSRIDATADRLFHKNTPEDCPTGEGRQDYLRAAALINLVQGRGRPADTNDTTEPAETADATDTETTETTETTGASDGLVSADVDLDAASEVNTASADANVDSTPDPMRHGPPNAPDATQAPAPPAGTPRTTDRSCSCGCHDGTELDITQYDNRCELLVVIDLDTLIHGLHEHSIINNGYNIELPVESYRRMACKAAIIPAVLDSNGVVLDQGRDARLANRAQRRALAAMYDTCAIPGCTVSSRHCQPHHITWSSHLGDTDLDNLLPLCSRHHHAVHEGGWHLTMHPDRSLTITYPNGTIQHTGPPARQRQRQQRQQGKQVA